MTIEYYHASKYGNGAMVAEEFKRIMATRGIQVNIHHIRDVKPREIPPADLYVFSSPGRIGKPLWSVRRFLRQARLAAGVKYALLTTQSLAQPDKNGRMPTAEEMVKWQRIIPIMHEILHGKGLVSVAEDAIHVVAVKGPLENGWEKRVADFAARIPSLSDSKSSGI